MLLNEQCDARPQFQRTGEKYVIAVVWSKRDSIASGTLIDGFLDAGGVEMIFGHFRRMTVVRSKLRMHRGADRRQLGFCDSPRVLGSRYSETEKEMQRRKC